jgi:hypothetical protein
MKFLPCAAKRNQIFLERVLNTGHIARGKAVVFPQYDRVSRAIQLKDSFMIMPDYMHMSRTMIIQVDDDSQRANPHNGWHLYILSLTKALGLFGMASRFTLPWLAGQMPDRHAQSQRRQTVSQHRHLSGMDSPALPERQARRYQHYAPSNMIHTRILPCFFIASAVHFILPPGLTQPPHNPYRE